MWVRAKSGLCLKKQSWPTEGGGRNPLPPILSLLLGVLVQVMVSQDQEVLAAMTEPEPSGGAYHHEDMCIISHFAGFEPSPLQTHGSWNYHQNDKK